MTTPPPGQALTAETALLARRGDLLRFNDALVCHFEHGQDDEKICVIFGPLMSGYLAVPLAACTFIGRPDSDGPTGERWSPVIDGDDGYYVSDHGRFLGPKGQLKPFRNSRVGHSGIKMHPSKKTILAHVAVARAFIGPRPEGMYVAHLNGVPDDNRRENIAYVSPAENSAHRRAHGTSMYAGRHPNAKFSDDDVRDIRALGPDASRRELARKYGVHRGTIENIISGRTWRQVDMGLASQSTAPTRGEGEDVIDCEIAREVFDAAPTPPEPVASALADGEGLEVVRELRGLCNGHPHAKIAWPHRELHRAADALEAAAARIKQLERQLEGTANGWRLAAAAHDEQEARADRLAKALGDIGLALRGFVASLPNDVCQKHSYSLIKVTEAVDRANDSIQQEARP